VSVEVLSDLDCLGSISSSDEESEQCTTSKQQPVITNDLTTRDAAIPTELSGSSEAVSMDVHIEERLAPTADTETRMGEPTVLISVPSETSCKSESETPSQVPVKAEINEIKPPMPEIKPPHPLIRPVPVRKPRRAAPALPDIDLISRRYPMRSQSPGQAEEIEEKSPTEDQAEEANAGNPPTEVKVIPAASRKRVARVTVEVAKRTVHESSSNETPESTIQRDMRRTSSNETPECTLQEHRKQTSSNDTPIESTVQDDKRIAVTVCQTSNEESPSIDSRLLKESTENTEFEKPQTPADSSESIVMKGQEPQKPPTTAHAGK